MSGETFISASARTSIANIRALDKQIAASQMRLATGKRVNGPSDNPTAYFAAAGLTSQANSLNALMDGIGNAERAMSAASNGIKAVQGLLQTAQTLATQALASSNTLVKVTGTNSSPLSVIASTSGSSTRLRTGDTVTVNDGSVTATYTAANGDTVQALLNAINNTANIKVTASLDDNGRIQLQGTGANNITIGGTVASSSGLTGATGLTAGTYNFTANSTRTTLAQQVDSIRTQIDQTIRDAGYNGVNLLNGGNVSVSFNEAGTSKLSVSGVSYTASGLGVAAVGSSNGGGNFQTDAEINATLSSITAAITTLQNQSSNFGNSNGILAARRDFSTSMANLLKSGAEDLLAADMTEESAALVALQTRQQIAMTSLSMAGEQSQNVLRLLMR